MPSRIPAFIRSRSASSRPVPPPITSGGLNSVASTVKEVAVPAIKSAPQSASSTWDRLNFTWIKTLIQQAANYLLYTIQDCWHSTFSPEYTPIKKVLINKMGLSQEEAKPLALALLTLSQSEIELPSGAERTVLTLEGVLALMGQEEFESLETLVPKNLEPNAVVGQLGAIGLYLGDITEPSTSEASGEQESFLQGAQDLNTRKALKDLESQIAQMNKFTHRNWKKRRTGNAQQEPPLAPEYLEDLKPNPRTSLNNDQSQNCFFALLATCVESMRDTKRQLEENPELLQNNQLNLRKNVSQKMMFILKMSARCLSALEVLKKQYPATKNVDSIQGQEDRRIVFRQNLKKDLQKTLLEFTKELTEWRQQEDARIRNTAGRIF